MVTTASTSTSAATGLTGGTTYQFRITATNAYGTGSVSSILSVVAAQAPDTPSAPTTSISGIYVKIAWTAPTNNNAAIDAYKITVKDSLATYSEDLVNCDGSDGTIVAQDFCLISMTNLISTYGLSL